MSQQTLTNADSALQDDYVEPIVRAVKEKKFLLDQIKADSSKLDTSGRRYVFDLHTKRNRGRVSAGSTEGSVLPTAGRQGFDGGFDKVKYHFYGLEITDAAIEGTAGSTNAFVDLLTEETEGVARDFQTDMNRQAWGDSTGTLAVVTGVNTTVVVPVDNLQWFEVGDPVDIRDASAAFVSIAPAAPNNLIVSIDYAGKTITLGAAPGTATAAGDLVTISGNYLNEINGVRNIFNKARVLHNVPTTVAQFQSRVTAMAGTVAGESSFQQLRDSINRRGFGKIEGFLTGLGIRRRLAGQYTSNKRYNDAKAVEIHAGYTAIFVDETPVRVDEDAQFGEVLAMTKDALTWVEQAPPNWLKMKDGSIFRLKAGTVAGTNEATWQATFKWYADLASFLPAKGGRLTNCADDTFEGI
jgi:hypothetical protein